MSFLLDGHRIVAATVHVPWVGPWWADVDLEGAPDVSGRVLLRLRDLELSGTVDPRGSGTHAHERRVQLVGGAGGWGTPVEARHYHNDAQVRAQTVAEDAARLAGEQLGDFAPAAERVGVDYVRQAGPASRVLEDVIGGVAWWVDYGGQTQVGARAASEPARTDYEVSDYEARQRMVRLTVDDPGAVRIGSVLTERLDEPQAVRELRIEVRAEAFDVVAWTGGEDGTRGRIDRALRGLVARYTDGRLFGKYRYRVSQMSSDRVELQAVRRGVGLPDMLPLSMWPGVAGAHAELTPGAHVLVEFIEGDRRFPIVTGFAGKDGSGWTPENLTLDVTTLLKLGASADNYVALANLVKARLDTIQSTFDAHTHIFQQATGTGVSGSTPVSTAAPSSSIGSLAAVAASKVKAE